MNPTSPPACRAFQHRLVAFLVVILASVVVGACKDADNLARLVPRVVAPGGPGPRLAPSGQAAVARPGFELPPRQPTEGFEFEAIGSDTTGQLLFQVRILQNGHPYQVAMSKLTPLFFVNGKSSANYVSEAYFRSNPHRTPFTIQPGDEFILPLPANTFIVRWQEERDEQLAHPARLREFVSERGDRLRYYLTDPFPIRYELLEHDAEGRASIQLHPDLAYLLGNGRTDALRVAQLIYRVDEPDIFQMEAIRRLVGTLQPGETTTIQVDRTQQHLDPVRDAWPRAMRTEQVVESDRSYLTRAVFKSDQHPRLLAIEDGVGDRTVINELVDGRVFRIEYGRDGMVQVYYKTGDDDARGKRDPYQLRENARWSTIYQRLAPENDPPVKWGPGIPSDLDPFPTARDANHHAATPEGEYDYLLPGRTIVFTFTPVRTLSSARAELEFHDLLRDIRDRYQTQLEQLLDLLERQQRKNDSVRDGWRVI